MIITVVGLGLIGGSFAKALSARTKHTVWGIDTNPDTVKKAVEQGAVKKCVLPNDLNKSDVVILALPPHAEIEFFEKNADNFKKGGVVFDCCGIKRAIIEKISPIAKQYDINFVGAHPMAGREFSGFDYSLENLFDKASFIVTTDNACDEAVDTVCGLAKEIGFGGIKATDANHHDRVIAYTSQLAHVVSSSYCKSPTIDEKEGFCAGSFADMTRVGKLDAKLWTELFMLNADDLQQEVENLIKNLTEYKNALAQRNEKEISRLLKEGNDIKVNSLKKENRL